MRVEVEPPRDWQHWRDLRLEALQDTPIGFGERYADARDRTDEEWLEALRRPGRRVVAYLDGAPVGMAGTFRDEQDRVHLFGVYVRPAARGQGVLEALVRSLQVAGEPLVLDVHEDNARAQAAYAKLGFVRTGSTQPYALDPARLELEMARAPVG